MAKQPGGDGGAVNSASNCGQSYYYFYEDDNDDSNSNKNTSSNIYPRTIQIHLLANSFRSFAAAQRDVAPLSTVLNAPNPSTRQDYHETTDRAGSPLSPSLPLISFSVIFPTEVKGLSSSALDFVASTLVHVNVASQLSHLSLTCTAANRFLRLLALKTHDAAASDANASKILDYKSFITANGSAAGASGVGSESEIVFRQLKRLQLDYSNVSDLRREGISPDSFPALEELSLKGSKVTDYWATAGVLKQFKCLKRVNFQDLSQKRNPHPDSQSSRYDLFKVRAQQASTHEEESFEESRFHKYFEPLHVSPLCKKRFYRSFLVASLSCVSSIDGLDVSGEERSKAFEKHLSAQTRKSPRSFVARVMENEIGIRTRKSMVFDRLGYVAPVPPRTRVLESTGRRPRQFEFHPTDPKLLLVGTSTGVLKLINHHTDTDLLPPIEINQRRHHVSERWYRSPSTVNTLANDNAGHGRPNAILGLSWLHGNHSSPTKKVLAGCDNGHIRLLDLDRLDKYSNTVNPGQDHSHGRTPCDVATLYCFPTVLESLTSVNVNCTDEMCAASGYAKNVVIYDVRRGSVLSVLKAIATEHINVVKFSPSNPNLLATSSFDKSAAVWDVRCKNASITDAVWHVTSKSGNVMVTWSPEGQRVLLSSVDNDVCLRDAATGQLEVQLDLPKLGTPYNYTRAYFLGGAGFSSRNGGCGTHVITGSCEESVLRVSCTQSGRLVREVDVINALGHQQAPPGGFYIQSLRGGHDHSTVAILAAHNNQSKTQIITMDLLATEAQTDWARQSSSPKQFKSPLRGA